MQLLGKRFLIKKDVKKYNGKIILLENNNDMHPFTGEIVLIGNQVKSEKYKIKDKVIFTEFGYEETAMMKDYDPDGIYLLVDEDCICGKILNNEEM